jgi:hypothetical protein
MNLPRPGLRAAACVVVAAVLIGLRVFALDPWRVEHVYVESIGPALTLPLIAATRGVPTSIAEWVEGIAILVAAGWIVAGLVRLVRGSPRTPIVFHLVGEATAALGAVLALFYVIWGLAYSRPDLEERMGWNEELEVDVFELESIGKALIDRVNDSYLEIHQLPDIGHMTGQGFDPIALDADLDQGWVRASKTLQLHPTVGILRGRTKPLISSGLFTYLGIGGFYFPFTGEANINTWAPSWQQPHTRAHEMGHQRFFASENEANFMGFQAAIHSDDPLAQYSGWLFAQRQVLRTLIRMDAWSGYPLLLQRYPGVQRDVNESRAFWTGYDGALSDVGNAVNDAYLKANNVEGGIQSYGRSVSLLIQWARTCGALPTEPGEPATNTLGNCDPLR